MSDTTVINAENVDPMDVNDVKPVAKRGRKKKVEEEPQAAAMFDGDYAKLLQTAVELPRTGQRGQKTLIKRLWTDHDEVVEQCTVSELRMALYEPSFGTSSEGIKLLASFMPKIGYRKAFYLMKRAIIDKDQPATNSTCSNYGEVILTRWKWDEKDENETNREILEQDVLVGAMHDAIFCNDTINGKFYQMLIPFANEKKAKPKLDLTVSRCLNSVLFRGLNALNNHVRYAASKLFFLFYPLVEDDEEEQTASLHRQYRTLFDLLEDDCLPIRASAAKMTLKILSEFWLITPKVVVKKLMTSLIDSLSRDNDVMVRNAVYEGMQYLMCVPACMNACEHALKCMIPRGINDKNEKVRTTSVQLLLKLRHHRFVNMFEIVSREEVIARLEIETNENVRKLLVQTIHALLPFKKDTDEAYYRPRVNYLIGKSRIAALTYFRMIVPLELVTVDNAVDIVKFLSTWVYRTFRSHDDDAELLSEDSPEFVRGRLYLECAIVLILSFRSDLSRNENQKSRLVIQKLLGKMLRQIFENYRNTVLVGTAMLMGNILPHDSDVLKLVSAEVMSMLSNNEIEEDLMDPYIEAIAHWNIEQLFPIISDGLDVLHEDLTMRSPKAKKLKKSPKDSQPERLGKALRVLKYLLRSYTTNALIQSRAVMQQKMDGFLDKLNWVTKTIDMRMEDEKSMMQMDDLLISALEVRLTLPTFLLNCTDGDSESEERMIKFYVKTMVDDLRWFKKSVINNMHEICVDEKSTEFVVKMSEVVLRSVNLSLSAWSFTSFDVEGQDIGEEDSVETISYSAEAVKIVVDFYNSNTPSQLMYLLFSTTATLSEQASEDMNVALRSVLEFAPKWIITCCGREEDEDIDEKKAADSLRQLWRACADSEDWDETKTLKFVFIVTALLITMFTETAEQSQNVSDPRDHDFEVPKAVSILVHRFIFKDKKLIEALPTQIGAILCGNKLVSTDLDTDSNLIRLGAVAQLAIACDPSFLAARKVGGTRRLSEGVENIFTIVQEKLDMLLESDDKPRDNLIVNQIKELLPKRVE